MQAGGWGGRERSGRSKQHICSQWELNPASSPHSSSHLLCVTSSGTARDDRLLMAWFCLMSWAVDSMAGTVLCENVSSAMTVKHIWCKTWNNVLTISVLWNSLFLLCYCTNFFLFCFVLLFLVALHGLCSCSLENYFFVGVAIFMASRYRFTMNIPFIGLKHLAKGMKLKISHLGNTGTFTWIVIMISI